MSGTSLVAPTTSMIGHFVLENAGAGPLGAGIATLGQLFAAGEVPAGATLLARIGDSLVPVQLDVKTTWPDGSARMAVLSLARPELAAGQSVEVTLGLGTAAAAPALDLASALAGHSFALDFAMADGSTWHVDALAALQQAIAQGKASFWQSGPLATEARVEIDLPGSLRLVLDITAYKGGGYAVSAQFNNDGAMQASGGRVQYGVTATMDGRQVLAETLDQGQYQNWHRDFSSTGLDGGQGLGSADAGWLNIRQDVAKLSALGAIADYDLSIAVPEAKLAAYAVATATDGWGDPLATNGVTTYMPMTGARADIGFTTQANTAWLLSQDARAANYALGQAEAASAVPWHFWDTAHGTWLNTGDYARLWLDGRGGTGRPGDATSGGLTQQVDKLTGWTTDTAHQPDLSYVPYLLTGERWILDNLLAQAAWSVMGIWPAQRVGEAIVVNNVQVRTAAWSLRQIDEAAFTAPDGSAEKAYFTQVSQENWAWLVSQIPVWTAQQGEAHGWLPGAYGTPGAIAPWQQDYFASTAIAAAARGNADALTFLDWMSNFLIGRFQAEAQGFNPHDGIAYNLAVSDPATGRVFQSWAEIGAATSARGLSNGDGWSQSNGDYGRLGLATLAGIWHLTGNPAARKAYHALLMELPPGTTEASLAAALDHLVTIPDILSGDDVMTPATTLNYVAIDLETGADLLRLANGTNTLSVANTETILGGTGSDRVTLTTLADDVLVDLGAGADALVLAGGGANRLAVAGVETVTGGNGDDAVRLLTPFAGGSIALGEGQDRLTLADGGNSLTVSGVETLAGGSSADNVTISGAATGMVDLGAGADRLVLGNAGSSATIANVETLAGGNGADIIQLGDGMQDAVIDLGAGADRLTLAAAGGRVRVANVETILGGAGNDEVLFTARGSQLVIDLGDGRDRLTLADGGNGATVSGAETILGGSGADTVTLGSALPDGAIDLGAGNDRLILAAGTNRLLLSNVETVTGGEGDDSLTFATALAGPTIALGGGNDRVVLADGGNTATLSGVETVIGGAGGDVLKLSGAGLRIELGAGRDWLTFTAASSALVSGAETITGSGGADAVTLSGAMDGVVDLGNGNDWLALGNGGNRLTVSRAETILGGTGDDAVILGTALVNGVIDLGDGNDRLELLTSSSVLSVSHVETLIGSAGNETVTLGSAIQGGVIDLGAGSDRLTLSSAGVNRLTVSGVEALLGGTTVDYVTLGAPVSAMTVDLGEGMDRLVMSSQGNNRATLANVEFITGGAGDDTVTLTTGLPVYSMIDLGGGYDKLQLANADNSATIANVEWLLGGRGADVIKLGAPVMGVLVDLGAGADRLTLANGTNNLTVLNAETILGGTGNDTVMLNTAQTDGVIDLGAGYDRLVLGGGRTSLTLSHVELVVGSASNDILTVLGDTPIAMSGNGSADTLIGGGRADTLNGGAGADYLTGGAGADHFVYAAASESGLYAADRITDFTPGQDLLEFSLLLQDSFTWRGAAAFGRSGGTEARFVDATQQLQIDLNGDGAADMAIVLQGVTAASLSARDFLWS
ncbi:M10 family metallopeptidase C-terminal domain-containing protein [Siccirubricoccus sp. KC 17139]|uniref:M10 family metallopeptidase C-terminal domain-containing protein n=1 Tax=Siccirubricoccus soli TaxID=2899147 RepID=A0ABT1D131_9PROT|nr:calcium-binding protein [Siccirubricoccus soli]MCO6414974.1 M10 family metallopeptidase C-terminal domain-containing protein [Siccirubricoccus soli]MCP2681105.1 M10 family metallopeptidase C-terminal domain-containing protein [Siccirubricoccus soli]